MVERSEGGHGTAIVPPFVTCGTYLYRSTNLCVYLDSLLAVEKLFVINFTPDKTVFDLHSQITSAVDTWLPVTTRRGVLRLRMEERPTDKDGSCEYIE